MNTIILGIDKYNSSEREDELIRKLNIAFTSLFLFEIIIKLVAVGVKKYF